MAIKQDTEPGPQPYGSGDLQYVHREYDIVDENGRHLGVLRTTVLRAEIKKAIYERMLWSSLHAIDERKVR